MTMRRAQNSLSQYRNVSVAGDMADAHPHRLVSLLLRGARERVQTAEAAIARNDIVCKARAINRAYAIIEGLLITLDRDRGGDVAAGLDSLYRYCNRRLLEANAGSDAEKLREVDSLLGEIESAWLLIAPGTRH